MILKIEVLHGDWARHVDLELGCLGIFRENKTLLLDHGLRMQSEKVLNYKYAIEERELS